MRKLAPDEAELWARVAATIRPLSRERLKPEVAAPTSPTAPALTTARPMSGLPKSAARPAPIPIGGQTLDGSWDKRIRSGDLEPDRVLDLHGMNLDHAWNAIDRTLEQAIQRGDRVVLLITGHHRAGAPPRRARQDPCGSA